MTPLPLTGGLIVHYNRSSAFRDGVKILHCPPFCERRREKTRRRAAFGIRGDKAEIEKLLTLA